MQKFVPVISATGKRLMPTSNKKADKLIVRGRALRRFDRGLFYIQLRDRADGYTQPIAIGIDPGSKREAFTVKSESHTYLNIQTEAVTWVKDHVETRRTMRRGRRYRKTPYRKARWNRNQGQFKLPPSTKARWGWKLRVVNWLNRYYPIDAFVVEDIQAVTKPGQRRWNGTFSPLEVGKQWFYDELRSWRMSKHCKATKRRNYAKTRACTKPATNSPTGSGRIAWTVGCWQMCGWVDTLSPITPRCCTSSRCGFIVANFTAYSQRGAAFASPTVGC